MARKPLQVTVDSSEVQGPGSEVTFRQLTWGDVRALTRLKGYRDDDFATLRLAASIADWNWTNSNDEPLPVPYPNGQTQATPIVEAMEQGLLANEYAFLNEQLSAAFGFGKTEGNESD